MTTDELVVILGRDAAPVRRQALLFRLLQGFSAGAAGAFTLSLAGLGGDGAIKTAASAFSLWPRLLYSSLLAAAALQLTLRLARPGAARAERAVLFAGPIILLGGIIVLERALAPGNDWRSILLGRGWNLCPAQVLLLAFPVFFGLCWSFRNFAPTNLRAAGAASGLAAGAAAASIYCITTSDISAALVLAWCTFGILLAGLAGAIVGEHLLRW